MALPMAYCDTSVWLKLYVKEEGSEAARQLAEERILVSSSILLTEALSALQRKRSNRELSAAALKKVVSSMSKDIAAVHLVSVGEPLLQRSREIVLKSSCGALDSLHLASALFFQDMAGLAIPFVTADRRQHDCAQQLGLQSSFLYEK